MIKRFACTVLAVSLLAGGVAAQACPPVSIDDYTATETFFTVSFGTRASVSPAQTVSGQEDQ